jgi:exopolyphosphatase/guanosine-5'-triphosphate,3'-diphosphate pyrophosphatase
VLLGWPGAEGLVCDIGGSSMELAELRAGATWGCGARPTGPLKLMGLKGGKKAMRAHIKDRVAELAETFPDQARPPVPCRRVVARHRPDRHGAARNTR